MTERNQKQPLDLHAMHTLYSGCTAAEKNELIERIWELEAEKKRITKISERFLAKKDSEYILARNACISADSMIAKLKEDVAVKDSEIERLKAQVSDEECKKAFPYTALQTQIELYKSAANRIIASRSVPQEGQPASNTQFCPGCHAVNRNHSTECKRLARTASNKEGTDNGSNS